MNTRVCSSAFTLVEVLVSSVIVIILAGILISATDMTARSYARTSAKIEQFSEARRGFETMTRRLGEATLNTYFDYYDSAGNTRPVVADGKKYNDPATLALINAFVPANFGRQSDLRFVSGPMQSAGDSVPVLDPDSVAVADRPTHGVFFQAPVGEVSYQDLIDKGVSDRDTIGTLDQSLNCWGYFLEVADDSAYVPQPLRNLVNPRRRSRLMEFRQPAEQNAIYWPPNTTTPISKQSVQQRNWWFVEPINLTTVDRPVRVVSENVIALFILPRLSRSDEIARKGKSMLTPRYVYDSTQASNYDAVPGDAEVNPKHQLPPVVQVVMVALDENSAARLEAEAPKGKPDFGLELNKDITGTPIFDQSIKLEDDPGTPQANDGDLSKLEKKLVAQRLTYRIFSTNVTIRGAKWSRAQTN